MVASRLALAVAAALMVRIMASEAAGQGPAGSFVVMVRVTDSAAMSAAEGVYTAPTIVASLKVPVPLVVQVELVALPPRAPDSSWVLPEHIVASLPALAVAAASMVSTMASEAAGQGPAGSFVVIVRVTVVAVMSAAEGVYTAPTMVALSKVPVPLVVQVELVALPALLPDKV